MQYKEVAVGGTVYFWFAANLTTGAAGDGATPLYDVRLAGAASSAAPTASGTPTLLSHANYTDGLHEIAIDTTGYATGEYAVFCTLTISSVNPAGFCGSFLVTAASDTIRDRLATIDTVVDAIKAKTDNLPSDPADASVVAGLIAAVETKVDTVDTVVDGIAAKTVNLPSDPADASVITARFDTLDATLAAAAEIQDIVDAVLDEPNADHLDAGTIGLAISTGGTSAGLITSIGTKILKYFQLALRKDAAITTDNATEVSEINADEGSGAGAYDNTTHSQEAIGDAAGGSAPSAATIADAVWDEAIAGHLTAGTTGAALNGAGSAGDPWTTPLPGAYGAGTAGKIIGDNINGTISSRATQVSVDAVVAQTDQLTFTQTGHVDANIQRINNVEITGDGSSGDKFDI